VQHLLELYNTPHLRVRCSVLFNNTVRQNMDAFEQVIARLLFQEGYWVNQSFKIELSKEEKREIGRPSSPRWEVDLLAYSGKDGSQVKAMADGETGSGADSASRRFVKLFGFMVGFALRWHSSPPTIAPKRKGLSPIQVPSWQAPDRSGRIPSWLPL
jgi:hypothetical protein